MQDVGRVAGDGSAGEHVAEGAALAAQGAKQHRLRLCGGFLDDSRSAFGGRFGRLCALPALLWAFTLAACRGLGSSLFFVALAFVDLFFDGGRLDRGFEDQACEAFGHLLHACVDLPVGVLHVDDEPEEQHVREDHPGGEGPVDVLDEPALHRGGELRLRRDRRRRDELEEDREVSDPNVAARRVRELDLVVGPAFRAAPVSRRCSSFCTPPGSATLPVISPVKFRM